MKTLVKNGIAVQGYDTVAFFNGNAVKGKASISADYQGAKYLFSSEENKLKFNANPNSYTPQYGGFCAMAVAKGEELRPNPKCFSVENGKLYFFTRIFFGLLDAKRHWLKKPEEQRSIADKEWENMNS